MKTKNFTGKKNSRRKKALILLQSTHESNIKEVEKNEKRINFLKKIVKNDPAYNESRKELAMLLLDNSEIWSKDKRVIKEIDILKGRITTDEVAETTRTKKNREGQMRKRRN